MADAKRQKSRQAEVKVKLKEPSMYNVVMLNDDVTTMDFVVEVLKEIFNKDSETAVALMLKVHHEGGKIHIRYSFYQEAAGYRKGQGSRLSVSDETG